MTNLMRKISDAMAKVDPKQVLASLAGSKPGPNEKAVGKASEELLQLWGVVGQTHKEFKQFARRALHTLADANLMSDKMPKEKAYKLLAENAEIENRLKITQQLFWASVRADFPETLITNISIREDGQIVTSEENASAAIIDVIEMLGNPRGLMDLLGRLRH